MINITIIAVGKIKENYLTLGIEEYLKRIKKYSKIEIIEIIDEKNPSNDNDSEIIKILEQESDQILSKIPKDSFIIALGIEGEMISSEALADLIDKTTQYRNNKIVFIIGSSHGLAEKVKKNAEKVISFSKMTFPHQLMRLILCEQLYRSLSILNHTSYHK
jgi:23S rRNA (pseudouridine1915-N3)-methyltransferase